MPAVADHRGGTTDGGGHHLVANHQHAQVVAGVVALQQHARIEMAGGLDGLLDLFRGAQVHRHALALLAVHRLDHQRTVLGEERGVFLRAAGQALLWLAQAGVLQARWVRTLSWQRVMLTAVVRSESDSRQRICRPPWVRVNRPPSASSTRTSMPRRWASSTMIRA